MNEADVKQDIMRHLKENIPAACAVRHEDIFRSGVPDTSVTYGGFTNWLEVKYLRPRETPSGFKKHFPALQLATCIWLEKQGRCDYLVAYPYGKMLHAALISPQKLAKMLKEDDPGPSRFPSFARAVSP